MVMVVFLVSIITFGMGMNSFLVTKATEERLASRNIPGSPEPFVTYDSAWFYFETSILFFAGETTLLVLRRKRK